MKGKNDICNNYVKNEEYLMKSIFNCKLYSSSLAHLEDVQIYFAGQENTFEIVTFVYLVFSSPKCVKDSLNLRFGPHRMKLENQSSIIVMAYHLGEQRKEKISSIDGLVISLVQSIQKVLLLNHFLYL